jgi:hypothetical protein
VLSLVTVKKSSSNDNSCCAECRIWDLTSESFRDDISPDEQQVDLRDGLPPELIFLNQVMF